MKLYRLAISAFAPVALSLFAWRALKGTEDSQTLAERTGRPSPTKNPTIWLHGASNGELHSARPLIERLRRARPDLSISVTTNTVSGRDMVNGWDMDGVSAFCAPLDLRRWIKTFLETRQVVAFIGLENELWPNRITLATESSLPVFLVAAKISRKSAKVWKRLPSIRRRMFQSITWLAPQDRGSSNRFKALGLRQDQIAPITELKSLYTPVEAAAPALPYPRNQIWLAASTHEGEELAVLQAHQMLLEKEQALLLLAPRHPRRAAEIRAMIEKAGLSCAQRSLDEQVTAETQVYLVDTMGEMPKWYRAAAATFVAGSFAAKGGHTPFEPAAYDTTIIHGPDTSNFRRIYRDLDAANAALRVTNPCELAEALPVAMAHRTEFTARASQVIQSSTDLTSLVSQILKRLPPPQGD